MRTALATLAAALALALALAVIAALTALALALEPVARVAPHDDVTPADIERAVALARQHDPRLAIPGWPRSVPLAQRDVDLLVAHAAQRFAGARTRVQLLAGRANVEASVPAPLGRWWNVRLGLRQAPAGLPAVEHWRVGSLPLPAALAPPLLREVARRHGLPVDALLAVGLVDRVTLAPGVLQVDYRLGIETAARLRAALLTPAEVERLRAYAARLAATSAAGPEAQGSLAPLLRAGFALAAERSAAGFDPVDENRAALTALALHASRLPLGLVLPAAREGPQAPRRVVTLRQRPDFALHFLVSALIAVQARTPLADAAGLWKELADAKPGGSGFSFADLLADRAGTRFGELALNDALRLQRRIAAGTTDAELMPEASGLPEFMPEPVFVERFGGVGSERYHAVTATIEARIAALPLYRP